MAKRNYTCECCGNSFLSAKPESGEHVCEACIEIRRCLKFNIKKHSLTVGEVLSRAGKLLLPYAEKKQN